MNNNNKGESNLKKAVDLSLTSFVNELCNEMGKNTAFLCGGVSKLCDDLDFSTLQDVVKSIIEDNEIHKIFFCNRNTFDRNFLLGISPETAKNLEIVLLTNKFRINYYNYVYPHLDIIEKKLDYVKSESYYRAFYNYALIYSKFMITGCAYDDDISVYIKEGAIRDEKTIIDFYSYFR